MFTHRVVYLTPTLCPFDELKNQWGWGGFTTQDCRCRLLAGMVALIYNWWSLFVRLADPDHHHEAITHGLSCCPPLRAGPARRAGDVDHQQHARDARQGARRLCPDRWLPARSRKTRHSLIRCKVVSHSSVRPSGTSYTGRRTRRRTAPQPRLNPLPWSQVTNQIATSTWVNRRI